MLLTCLLWLVTKIELLELQKCTVHQSLQQRMDFWKKVAILLKNLKVCSFFLAFCFYQNIKKNRFFKQKIKCLYLRMAKDGKQATYWAKRLVILDITDNSATVEKGEELKLYYYQLLDTKSINKYQVSYNTVPFDNFDSIWVSKFEVYQTRR